MSAKKPSGAGRRPSPRKSIPVAVEQLTDLRVEALLRRHDSLMGKRINHHLETLADLTDTNVARAHALVVAAGWTAPETGLAAKIVKTCIGVDPRFGEVEARHCLDRVQRRLAEAVAQELEVVDRILGAESGNGEAAERQQLEEALLAAQDDAVREAEGLVQRVVLEQRVASLRSAGARTTPAGKPSAPRDLMTIEEAAEFMGVSVAFLDNAVRRPPEEYGSVPFVVIPTQGKKIMRRFSKTETWRWLMAGAPPVAAWRKMQGRGASGSRWAGT